MSNSLEENKKISLEELLKRQYIKTDLNYWKKFKINPASLYKEGFNPFPDQMKSAQFAMQKRYDDKLGKKYFITIYFHYMSEIEFPTMPLDVRPSWNAQSQFRLLNTGAVSDISLHDNGQEHTLKEVEAYFEELFNKMGFAYYDSFAYEDEDAMNQRQLDKQEACNIKVQKFEIEAALEPIPSKSGKVNKKVKNTATKI